MIIREAGSGTLQVVKEALGAKGLSFPDQFNIMAEIGNTAGIIGGIKTGLGVSIFSTRAVEEKLSDGRLMALDVQGIDLERSIYLVVDRRRSLSPLAVTFQDYVLEHGKN